MEGDLGCKKLDGEGFSIEGEGTVDSSINDGHVGHHAKHIHGDTWLGDASSRQSRIELPRLPFWKRFQSLFKGSASGILPDGGETAVKRLSENARKGEKGFITEIWLGSLASAWKRPKNFSSMSSCRMQVLPNSCLVLIFGIQSLRREDEFTYKVKESDSISVIIGQSKGQLSLHGPNGQPIEGDIGRKKLVGEGFSDEGEGTVDSSINNGDGGHHAKPIHDDTRLGDASNRQSRTRPSRFPCWKRFQSLFRGSASVNSGPESPLEKTSKSGSLVGVASPRLTGITMDQSVEFSYEELVNATDDFSLSNKIGQGGFGAVYYAELRGEKAAIKKMDMRASREFLAELKVLTHVHHLNLVRLIGYCVEGSLFLVYEFIENGNLNQQLRASGREPLPWSARVQIALDSARGLEYIHEHMVPVFIHRDIKPANILIDKNFHAKVADFGLTKLIEVGSASLMARLVGTFGYMPP
ncbi:hypothetical protein RJ639_006068, partial [Escallonia herrerae]